MRRGSQWNDKDIEELLQNLPQVKDKRSSQEIYQNIELRINKKRRSNWVPLFATVAALFVLTVLASSFMLNSENSTSEDVAIEKTATEGNHQESSADKKGPPAEEPDIAANEDKNEEAAEAKRNSTEEKSVPKIEDPSLLKAGAVLASDLENQSVITIGVPDTEVNYVIPVSYVTEDGSDETAAELSQVMSLLEEDSLGLDDYFPLDATITTENQQTINIDLPEDSSHLLEDRLFFKVIQETFKYQGGDRVTFSTNGEKGAEFSHHGFLEEIEIESNNNRAYFIYQLNEGTRKMLVPSNSEFTTIEEALAEMKNGNAEEDPSILPSIPQQLEWDSIEEQAKKLIVKFSGDTKIEDTEAYLYALEAILFTAKDFGFDAVKFENVTIDAIGPYNLQNDLAVPIAPNRIN
ncbi:hypothetical protein [Bacillus sp. V59.32b]|uniref:hypothetical protein n=1 Tax=Bacillus sp. V59.32b TaxID=1758642 RepID=UPI000E3CE9C2|nr:hypothetical protein [Bacillus sp. V59.32b]RFU69058.1 hypothetical protein D0463_03220 [Bacillus sp. V59.32b]